MRCPACDLENSEDAPQCSGCGATLARRQRRRAENGEENANARPDVDRCNATAATAYRLCLLALIPGIGLILGPIGLVMGTMARLQGRNVKRFTGSSQATVSILLSALITATQWAGAAMMIIGWRAER
jgi:hypothetical protein